jgi:periplasmic divalent cation tolerance protein
MTDKIVVLMTCGTAAEAARIARSLVERRIAACVNILRSPVRSVYRWKNKIETARERLLVIKTSRQKFPQLCAHVKRLHSYAVPEIIALPIAEGSAPYLRWVEECLRPGRMKKNGKQR